MELVHFGLTRRRGQGTFIVSYPDGEDPEEARGAAENGATAENQAAKTAAMVAKSPDLSPATTLRNSAMAENRAAESAAMAAPLQAGRTRKAKDVVLIPIDLMGSPMTPTHTPMSAATPYTKPSIHNATGNAIDIFRSFSTFNSLALAICS